MTKKARHNVRLAMDTVLCLVLATGTLLAGCGQAPQSGREPAMKTETKTQAVTVLPTKPAEQQAKQQTPTSPASAAPVAKTPEHHAEKSGETQSANVEVTKVPTSIPEKIEDCENLFQLHGKVAELKKTGGLNPKVSAAIDKKHAALLEKATVFHFSDKLDLLAVSFTAVSADKGRIGFLFRPNDKLTGYKIGVNAFVDKSHAKHLSSDADMDSLCEVFTVWPTPPTTEWVPGEEILIETEKNLQAIPYHLFVGIYASDSPEKLGERQDLGWYADLGDGK